ncbi:hypothetical protein QQY66_44960 [Streptomyces sp. DG2A-72]|nr:hypothetical protein [Streptomyces sp. DG2A-72]MDO0938531.1 hypothetical protein [Streptomyces sp. DG2A-72]
MPCCAADPDAHQPMVYYERACDTSYALKFRWAYIKGCADCYAYIVYP